jgi:hypothetical protein
MNEGPSLIPGTWHSVYEYESSSRGETLTDERDLAFSLEGDLIRVRSLPGSPSHLEVELAFRGPGPRVLIGTWVERTDPDGYYAGITYVGTALFILTEDSRSMTGRWLGGDRDVAVVNTGTWTLTLAR